MPSHRRRPVRGETDHGVAKGAADEAEGHGSTFADLCDHGFDEKRTVDDGADSDERKGETDGAVGPAVAVVGVDDVDVHQDLLCDVTEQENGGDGDHAGVAAEKRERADGVGAGPGKGAAVLQGEGFGQDEEAVESVDKRETARGPEGQARIDVAEQTTDGGAKDEAGPEGRVQHAEGGGASLAGGDVGHVGHGGWDAGGGEAGDDTAEKEPAECGGPGHEEVVEAEAEVGEKDNGAAAEAVGERAEDGREEELHGGKDCAEEAEHFGRAGGVAVEEAFDETRQDGGDHAEGEHIECDSEEDKGRCGAAAFGRMRRKGGVELDEFGLGHQRVG